MNYLGLRMANDPKTWLVRILQGVASFFVSGVIFLFFELLGFHPEVIVAHYLAISVPVKLWSATALLAIVPLCGP
jgi:hypothetical protein